MRICLVSHEYPPDSARGGIGTQTWNKAHALVGLGHDVEVVAAAGGRGKARSGLEDGIKVHRIEAPGYAFPVYEAGAYWMGFSWAVLACLRMLEDARPFDVLSFPEYGGEGVAYLADRTPWTPEAVVVQLHGPLDMFAARIGWPEAGSVFHQVGGFMERFAAERADGLMASSHNIADFAAERWALERTAIDVVHCGVGVDLFRPGEAALRDPDHRPTVLFVGNIVANKGVKTVLEAVLRLRADHPRLRLVLAGKGDEGLLEDLRRRAESARAADALEYAGFIGDRRSLPALYASADVFCSPAHHEVGVANVYVEAMACGVPVVACDTGGAPEAVTHEVTGLLVPPGDVEATTSALHRILADESLRTTMSGNARRRAVEYFAQERYIERVLRAYERALQRRASRTAALGAGGGKVDA
jgi:glycosyltransferase involved in cell wall biosynthesis